jgi:ribonuclease Z
MSSITFLGTASAVPAKNQQNTHLIVQTGQHTILVDCVGNPVVRLQEAGIDPLTITDLILTHFHPDHVSGVPLLLMDLWLLGRKAALKMYGLQDVIVRMEQMLDLYDWQTWQGFYPVQFLGLPDEPHKLMENAQIELTTFPVCHMIPGIGIKMVLPDGGFCYSSDTGPCATVIEMARGMDFLIHEATGEGDGHSSPAQAGRIAEQADVKRLYLIHYPPDADEDRWVSSAKTTFSGEVILAKDLMVVQFPG